jgi:hypothetical protein
MLIMAYNITESRDGSLKPDALNPARQSESNEYHFAHKRMLSKEFNGWPMASEAEGR